ncbi:MAG: hypothetical protein JWM73_1847 [Solirubrobacterales bacterium]|nr:hypothetical protein [Solirubrobacterales bacterium]
MIKRILVAAVAATVLTTGVAEAKPKARTGVVVHKAYKAKGFVWANSKGRLSQVHRAKHARFAHRVAFRGRQVSEGQRTSTAKVRGAVTAVDEAARTFTVSGNGASILVHLADTTKALPAVGDAVLVIADLTTSTPTTLEASDVVVNPAAAEQRKVEIEGVVLSINESTRTLTLSADDSEESGDMIAVVIPADLDLSKFAVGDSVELLATLNDDGQTFTAVAVDDHNCGDDDFNDEDHGGQSGDDSQGEDHSGPGRSGDDSQAGDSQAGDDQSGDDNR